MLLSWEASTRPYPSKSSSSGVLLEMPAMKRIYRRLMADMSGSLPKEASEEQRKLVAFNCFTGQPVNIAEYAVMRFAIGPALAVELGEDPDFLETALREDRGILDKIRVLLKYHAVM